MKYDMAGSLISGEPYVTDEFVMVRVAADNGNGSRAMMLYGGFSD